MPPAATRRFAIPRTLWVGLILIITIEALLAVDVAHRGGLVAPLDNGVTLPEPVTRLEKAARNASYNITPICWVGYLFVFDGLLTLMARRRGSPGISSLRARPNRFIVAWLTSIPVWCVFDYVNFRYLDAWRYHGMPPDAWSRYAGYFIAFAAISPGMFLAAQAFQHLGMKRWRTTGDRVNRVLPWVVLVGVHVILAASSLLLMVYANTRAATHLGVGPSIALLVLPGIIVALLTRRLTLASLAFGLGFGAWAVLARDPVGNMALWVGLIFVLDPVSAWLGGPSILRDWQHGRWGRMLALFAGGALCGLLWEFWNYWALSKWTYHLPFLGSLEHYRYFEMPLLGFLGFLPFAVECWVMLNVIVAVLDRAGVRVAERLPDEDEVM